ncbi:MAG: AAA family ATPase [Candidatus Methanomethylophilaceae archaeon]|nr:AAA family ATPase [Candidatus Methanomethylophilaceae archaeon]
MKIKSIQIYGLFNEYDYCLDLNPDLTYLHAPNGSGKSTLLRLIKMALGGEVDRLAKTPFSRLDIFFDDGSTLIIENEDQDLRVQMQKTELETPIGPEEMGSLLHCVYAGADRTVVPTSDGHLAQALDVFIQELSDRYASVAEAGKIKLLPTDGDMNDVELEQALMDVKAKLDYMKSSGLEPEIPAKVRFPPTRYDIASNKASYISLLKSLREYVDKGYQLAESIITYQDTVNSIFINKTLTITEYGRMTVSMNNGTALRLCDLSSGEKQILVMFYLLLFRTGPGDLAIVDEPEISLHVCWQQMLGNYYLDICRVRGIQMLVATHSPQVIHDRWDLAVELRSR